MANSVDPDQPPRSAASDLGQLYLLKSVCPNISDKYDTLNTFRLPLYGQKKRGYDLIVHVKPVRLSWDYNLSAFYVLSRQSELSSNVFWCKSTILSRELLKEARLLIYLR